MRLYITIILLAFFLPGAVVAGKVPYPEIEEVTGENGAKAWLIKNHILPIVTIKLTFKNTGSAYDPDGKTGLANMATDMLDEGTPNLDATSFKKKLESLGTEFSTQSYRDSTHISIRMLKENMDESLSLIRQAISSPRLDDRDIKRIRSEILLVLAKEKEKPAAIANLQWQKQMFGDHPYARNIKGDENTITNITKMDIRNFISNHFTRNNLIMSIAGDITSDKAANLLDIHLNFPDKTSKETNIPNFLSSTPATKKHITHPVDQTTIVFGHQGIPYKHPDFYAAHILNYIIGGGSFRSRLVEEIREKRGLAYSTYTYLDFYQNASLFRGYVATRKEEVENVQKLIKTEFEKLKINGITANEMDDAKRYITGSFPLRMTSSLKLVNLMDFIQRWDLGINFLHERNERVDSVTLEDINRVAKSLLQPDKLVTVTVGK